MHIGAGGRIIVHDGCPPFVRRRLAERTLTELPAIIIFSDNMKLARMQIQDRTGIITFLESGSQRQDQRRISGRINSRRQVQNPCIWLLYTSLNQKHCMEVMLENKVIPIVNENDTISVTELMFTDNDELSGLIATMMGMDVLIILSNIDGIYNGNPSDPSSTVIREIDGSKEDLSEYVQTSKSSFGRGGMLTKCSIAQKVADEGITGIIANGKKDNILVDLLAKDSRPVCTRFKMCIRDRISR